MEVIDREKRLLIYNDIAKKIINKKSLLQFLPSCLEDESKQKIILYKENKIKPAYLIDIVNTLILKYYFFSGI